MHGFFSAVAEVTASRIRDRAGLAAVEKHLSHQCLVKAIHQTREYSLFSSIPTKHRQQ